MKSKKKKNRKRVIKTLFLSLPGIIFLLLLIALTGCFHSRNKVKEVPIAKVYEKYFYASQLKNIVPSGLSIEDSIIIVKDHIDKWIRNQLLLYQAELYLSPEEKNVEKQIEDYRTSLLIFKYEQSFIREKLDTAIREKDIQEYYNTYSSNFILNNNLLKGIFIQVPRSAPEIYRIRSWYRSDDPENIKKMEQYCYNNATKFDYFEEILKDMPQLYTRPENILQWRKAYETKDSTYYYFLKISDFRLEGSVTPIEMVRDDIKNILLNKRKIELIQKLESNIYNDALNRGNFVVY